MINLRSQVFSPKNRKNKTPKKKKKQAMCSENFQGMSQEKIIAKKNRE